MKIISSCSIKEFCFVNGYKALTATDLVTELERSKKQRSIGKPS